MAFQSRHTLAAELHLGDRVRTRVATSFVQAGTFGRVCASYPVMPDAYDVQFDGQPKPWLMWDDELEPLDEVTQADVPFS